jgi:integrase
MWPHVSAKQARVRRDELKALLRVGIDPAAKRKAEAANAAIEYQKAIEARKAAIAEKKAAKIAEGRTFGRLATAWFDHVKGGWRNAKHREQVWQSLEVELAPLWERGVATITPAAITEIMRKIDARPAPEVARRTLQRCSAAFRWGVVEGWLPANPAADLRPRDVFPRRESGEKHYARVGIKELPPLVAAIDQYRGWQTRLALKLLLYLFVRPGELRRAPWGEFDLDGDEPVWRIPAGRMKAGREHLVPLSKQAAALLRDLEQVNRSTGLVMPNEAKLDRPASENVFAQAFKKMGLGGKQTAHGFRALATTQLREMGWPNDVVEAQLAHTIESKARRAYDSAEYLPQRRAMMQAWAEYVDGLARR